MLLEMGRIAPHRACSSATWRCSSAQLTPVFYAFRDREFVLNQIEAATGGRFHPNFDRIGGVKDDFPKGWIEDTKAVMKRVRGFCDQMEDLLLGNEIFEARTRGIGVIPRRQGPSLRPLRRQPPRLGRRLGHPARQQRRPLLRRSSTGRSGPTPTVTATAASGSGSRRPAKPATWSTRCAMACRAARSWPRCPRIIKVPAGEAYVATENPLGEMGFHVICKGDLGPYRVKIRTASFSNMSSRRGC